MTDNNSPLDTLPETSSLNLASLQHRNYGS
jgi:hypothetical protein